MKFANIITEEITDTLPKQIGATWNPTFEQLAAIGWRDVVSVDEPDVGYRLVKRGIMELSPTTCKLTVAASVSIADEQSAQAAMIEADRQWQANSDNWPKQFRFILALLKPAIKPAMTITEYKAWLKNQWENMP